MKTKINSLVTGGVQGIGKAIVEKLIERGDQVFIFDRLPSDDPRVQDLLKKSISYFSLDISSSESVKNGFSQISQILDSSKSNLDLLVNNAGITKDNLALRMSEQDWDSVLDVNLKGAFLCCQQALKRMMRQEKSYIINISSIVGKNGNIGQSNYAASKAGLIALTKSLAQEYGSRNILVNAIAPGFIQTEMTEKLPQNVKDLILSRIALKRFGSTEDVANLVSFLSSGYADYITGAVIDLNGGLF
jgi:3-oxoacyl-[acyl-carrier protein] reductase